MGKRLLQPSSRCAWAFMQGCELKVIYEYESHGEGTQMRGCNSFLGSERRHHRAQEIWPHEACALAYGGACISSHTWTASAANSYAEIVAASLKR